MPELGPEPTIAIPSIWSQPRNKRCLFTSALSGYLGSESLGRTARRSGSPWRSTCAPLTLVLAHPIRDNNGSDEFLHRYASILSNLSEFGVDLRVKGLHELGRHFPTLPVYRPHP